MTVVSILGRQAIISESKLALSDAVLRYKGLKLVTFQRVSFILTAFTKVAYHREKNQPCAHQV